VKNLKDERLFAVDLNSRFETAPGMKDIKMLEKAITIIRN
jgi:phosphoribosylanthranilate isomerase